MRKMCKSMPDDRRPCGKLQQSGMYPLWKMCECVSEKGVETWNEIKTFVKLYKIDEKIKKYLKKIHKIL